MAYWTVTEASKELQVSIRHIRRLIAEADQMPKQARWQWGKQLLDLCPKTSVQRTIRINSEAL